MDVLSKEIIEERLEICGIIDGIVDGIDEERISVKKGVDKIREFISSLRNEIQDKREAKYAYPEMEDCAVHYGIELLEKDAPKLYKTITTRKSFLKNPTVGNYLSLLGKHFKGLDKSDFPEGGLEY